jgi:hypothetical protein
MLGQIARLIDDLHLSYHEVVEEIPYRNLLIMQKDKIHTVTGVLVKKVSGRDLANRRKK